MNLQIYNPSPVPVATSCRAFFSAKTRSSLDPILRQIAEARKIAESIFDALLVFDPLAVVLYFLAYPDRFNTFLNWIFGHR